MKVKNLFTINPSGSTKQFEGFINYIDTSSVIDGKLITVQYLNDNYPSRAKRVIKKDDILYSTVRPNLRHYYHHVINIDHSVASTGFAVLRNIDDRKADTKFVFYYLTLPYIVNYLDNYENLKDIDKLSTKDALKELMKIKGIGLKVASCILLFGYRRLDVFPIDTWVKQYMVENYNIKNNQKDIENFARDKFGEYSGLVIQYMFHSQRNM